MTLRATSKKTVLGAEQLADVIRAAAAVTWFASGVGSMLARLGVPGKCRVSTGIPPVGYSVASRVWCL